MPRKILGRNYSGDGSAPPSGKKAPVGSLRSSGGFDRGVCGETRELPRADRRNMALFSCLFFDFAQRHAGPKRTRRLHTFNYFTAGIGALILPPNPGSDLILGSPCLRFGPESAAVVGASPPLAAQLALGPALGRPRHNPPWYLAPFGVRKPKGASSLGGDSTKIAFFCKNHDFLALSGLSPRRMQGGQGPWDPGFRPSGRGSSRVWPQTPRSIDAQERKERTGAFFPEGGADPSPE